MTTAADSDPKRRRFPLGLWLAVAAYFVTRGLVLHTSFDEVGLWMYEVFPMGTLAELAIRGIHVPPYFFYDNADRELRQRPHRDRKSTRLNSSHTVISYAVFCLLQYTPIL